MKNLPEKLSDLHRELQLMIINKIKKSVLSSNVFKDMLKDWDAEDDVLDFVPVAFSDEITGA